MTSAWIDLDSNSAKTQQRLNRMVLLFLQATSPFRYPPKQGLVPELTPPEAWLLRHLRAGALESPGHPSGVWETANGESFQLPIHVILHAADGGLEVVEQEVSSAAIAIVR